MNMQDRAARIPLIARNAARWLAGDLRAHWASALFSVVVAFVVWVLIEDVGDPFEETRAPANSGIQVTAVNVPDEYLEPTLSTVIVQVRGRQSDIEGLRPEDFRATVDLKDVGSGTQVVTLSVRVTPRRDGVEVLEVIPATMEVRLQPAFRREIEVTANILQSPPAGFQIRQVDGREAPPEINPPLVTILGPQELVERVASVEFDVSLANARTQTYTVSGDLVARSQDGNVIQVRISATRVEATFAIESVFSPLTLGLRAVPTGAPAHGYQVVAVTVEPSTVELTGRQEILDGLQESILLEPVDISNATDTVTQVVSIEPPANVSANLRSATVTVRIEPIVVTRVFYPLVTYTDLPDGLAIGPGNVLTTSVTISGNLADVDKLTEDQSRLVATISFAGATAGTMTFKPVVKAQSGISVGPIGDVSVTLIAVTPVVTP